MSPKTVCIVGAGPSGLVAAKTLLHDMPKGHFQVTVVEAKRRVGGLWPNSVQDDGGMIHPRMVTNQSRHTMQFSDMAWPRDHPQFPTAWMVGQYLERYATRYCAEADLRFGTRVLRADLDEHNGSWLVHMAPETMTEGDGGGVGGENGGKAKSEPTETLRFDYLLVASGFFGSPAIPECIPSAADAVVPIVHSSAYRNLEKLLLQQQKNQEQQPTGRKIVVVGSQMSGVEISGAIAAHLSSMAHSPAPPILHDIENYTVHHVVQRPVWIFPLFTTPEPLSPRPRFVPLDLYTNDISRRKPPLVDTQGHVTEDRARLVNSMIKSMLGTSQMEYSPLLSIDGAGSGYTSSGGSASSFSEQPPWIAISDYYLEFVRSGLIQLSPGKLAGVADGGRTIRLSDGSDITNVAAIVLATGFGSSTGLEFLPENVLRDLHWASDQPDHPVALACHGTYLPSCPSLGFVGFYRGPYWGVMEMQARMIAALWSSGSNGAVAPVGDLSSLPEPLRSFVAADGGVERTLALRNDRQCAQFPHGDYLFIMAELARGLGMDMSLLPGDMPRPIVERGQAPMDILTPARFPYANRLAIASATVSQGDNDLPPDRAAQVRENLAQTNTVTLACLNSNRFVARAVFRSLLGAWRIDRSIRSRLPSHPSGRFVGTATFHLRRGTGDGRLGQECDDAVALGTLIAASEGSSASAGGDDKVDADARLGDEYLYEEHGEFRPDSAMPPFQATRRYVWRYVEERDELSVWFARESAGARGRDRLRADYLFHVVEFAGTENAAATAALESEAAPRTCPFTGRHLSVDLDSMLKEYDRRRRINAADDGADEKFASAGRSGVGVDATVAPVASEPSTPSVNRRRGWAAKAGHLCINDFYEVNYDFRFNAVNLAEWTAGYSVKGPKKDYTIHGVYTRAVGPSE